MIQELGHWTSYEHRDNGNSDLYFAILSPLLFFSIFPSPPAVFNILNNMLESPSSHLIDASQSCHCHYPDSFIQASTAVYNPPPPLLPFFPNHPLHPQTTIPPPMPSHRCNAPKEQNINHHDVLFSTYRPRSPGSDYHGFCITISAQCRLSIPQRQT
jgi:hypothetical protein